MSADAPRAFVIGHPVAHSRSPLIHGHWLERHGIAGSYERIDVPPSELSGFLASLGASGFAGGNVTIPLKEVAFGLVAEATSRARRLGAVNTLWMENGRVLGDTTDGEGFLTSLDEAVGPSWRAEVETALVIGAGGAARAIIGALLDAGVPKVAVTNRTDERAVQLTALDCARVSAVPWRDRDAALPGTDLLINTTQCGMLGHPPLAIEACRLPARAIVADIVYVPLETPLLRDARRHGLRVADGLGMLLHQAAPGFARWFGLLPPVTSELRALVAADIGR